MSKKSSTFAPAFLRKGTLHQGKMAEWSNASVLKTDVRKRTGGSNPSLSARLLLQMRAQACLSEQMQESIAQDARDRLWIQITPVQNKDRRFLLESWNERD